MDTFIKTVKYLIGLIIFFALMIFLAMSVIDSPGYAWRIVTMLSSSTDDYKVFPNRTIEKGILESPFPSNLRTLPSTINFDYGQVRHKENLDDLLKRTGTSAFLMVKDDQVIVENYYNSFREDIHTSFSIAKSFDSAMIGAAIADGYIESIDEPVIDFIPEIAGRGLDSLTIRNLLRMDTGIRYRTQDDWLAPFSDDALTYYSTDMRELVFNVKRSEKPISSAFLYNNFHPLLEGVLLERATGMPVAQYLQERIWKPIGAEFPASWSLDSKASGFEKMESGINARAIDYARFGLLYLHNGEWNGQQILPEKWVLDSTSPNSEDERNFDSYPIWKEMNGYYGYHWWGLRNKDGSYDFMAQGHLGQIIYIAPRNNSVVVRLGEEPDKQVNWAFVLQALIDEIILSE